MMNVPKSHPLYQGAARVKDGIIEVACSLGFISDPQTLELGDYRAEFRVTTSAERWRVQQHMHETDVLSQLLDEINRGDRFWDIGAAVGTYSCLADDAGASPIAFEPHPENHARCEDNFNLNGLDAPVIRKALSDQQGSLRLPTGGEVGTGTFELSESGSIEVKTIRGDEVDEPQPDVIKVDVEGHELRVLAGMDGILGEVRSIYVECHPKLGVNPEEVDDVLQEHGFQTEFIELDRDEPYIVGRRPY